MNRNGPLQKAFYDYLTSRTIVYHACMEDPRVDTRLLDLDSDSTICMLASAGCNALHYLLEDVRWIDCVDLNPCQIALVDLKCSVLKHGSYQDLWSMFGNGCHPGVGVCYRNHCRQGLRPESARFWDGHLHHFRRKHLRRSFYDHHCLGFTSLCLRMISEERRRHLEHLFTLDDREKQAALFEEHLEPILGHRLARGLIRFAVLTGVPSRQMRMIGPNGRHVHDVMVERIRKTLTQNPAVDNYFFYLHLFGRYRHDCCPEYLKLENYELLRDRQARLHLHCAGLADFLDEQAGRRYSHFCLLDHLDWLVDDRDDLDREWRAVLTRSETGTKILLRTYLTSPKWMPPFLRNHVRFIEGTDEITAASRIGIYSKTHLLEVSKPL